MDKFQRQIDAIRKATDIAAPFREILQPIHARLDSVSRLSDVLNYGIGSEVRKVLDAMDASRAIAQKLAGPDFSKALFQIDHILPKFNIGEELMQVASSGPMLLLSKLQHNEGIRLASEAIKLGSVVRASFPNFGSISEAFEALSELERQYGHELGSDWDDLSAIELIEALEQRRSDSTSLDSSDVGETNALDRLQSSVDASIEAVRSLGLKLERASSPWSGLGRDIAMNLVFGLLFMLVQNLLDQRENEEAQIRALQSAEASESALMLQVESNRRLERIEEMQRQMQDAIMAYESTLDAMPANAVVRVRTALRANSEGRVIGYLEAGQEFVVLDKSGKWIEIRFRDGDNNVVLGWVRKKHCAAIQL